MIAGVKGVGKTSLLINLTSELSELCSDKFCLYCYSSANAFKLPEKSDRIKILELLELPMQTGHIYLESKWAKEDHGLSAVIVDDYRFLLRTESFHEIDLTKSEKILYLLTRFKTLAEVYDVPVIITCGVDDDYIYGRKDKRPLISDVQDCQYINAFADRIILMHREDIFHSNTEKTGIADFMIIEPYNDLYHNHRFAYFSGVNKFCEVQSK